MERVGETQWHVKCHAASCTGIHNEHWRAVLCQTPVIKGRTQAMLKETLRSVPTKDPRESSFKTSSSTFQN